MKEAFQEEIEKQVSQVLEDLNRAMPLHSDHLLVVGCSTSEVIGKHIGTAGTMEVAGAIYRALSNFRAKTGVNLAFQCCEHLNRALVIDRKVAKERGFERVTVTPVRSAGGAMATFAFNNMEDPVVVEYISADCGIDIGDTLIGMHLKRVAVPVRSELKEIGHAHLTMARTRPKLIGGERAVYPEKEKVTRF
ncbi:TIGR01440 family protein [Terrilactibacillus sp. S3-3]|nr:TIGR01440 family protein [Terrilactibacillus sp. S3-3]